MRYKRIYYLSKKITRLVHVNDNDIIIWNTRAMQIKLVTKYTCCIRSEYTHNYWIWRKREKMRFKGFT